MSGVKKQQPPKKVVVKTTKRVKVVNLAGMGALGEIGRCQSKIAAIDKEVIRLREQKRLTKNAAEKRAIDKKIKNGATIKQGLKKTITIFKRTI